LAVWWQNRKAAPGYYKPIAGVLINGGPCVSHYLDEEGELWPSDIGEESIQRVAYGPRKVGVILIAAEHVPELAEWLLKRPATARDCELCGGNGWYRPSLPRVLCSECHGMVWRE
jgi:hypothetical protein